MSRTYKDKKGYDDGASLKRRMKPYVKDKHTGWGKFTNELVDGIKITETAKLVTKNANRSLKKSARQEAKQQLKQILNGRFNS